MEENLLRIIKNAINWLLTIVTAVYIMTGFGITENRIAEHLTLGLLSKALSFKVHLNLEIAFMILLLLHISLGPIDRIYRRLTGRKHREYSGSPSQ